MGKENKNFKKLSVTEAYLANHSFLKKFLMRFLWDKASVEDIAQEAFLRSYKAEKKSSIHSPKAFLFKTAKNLALNELDKKANQLNDYIEDSCDSSVLMDEASVENCVQAQERFEIFCQAASRLPPKCRQVFLLRKVYGYSHKEIANKLGLSVSTVEKHVASGLQRCHQYLKNADVASVAAPVIPLNSRQKGANSR